METLAFNNHLFYISLVGWFVIVFLFVFMLIVYESGLIKPKTKNKLRKWVKASKILVVLVGVATLIFDFKSERVYDRYIEGVEIEKVEIFSIKRSNDQYLVEFWEEDKLENILVEDVYKSEKDVPFIEAKRVPSKNLKEIIMHEPKLQIPEKMLYEQNKKEYIYLKSE